MRSISLLTAILAGTALCLATQPAATNAAKLEILKKNIRKVGIAIHNYHEVFKSFPPTANEKRVKPLLSWRVHLLPFLGYEKLYAKFNIDEPWDSPTNKKLLAQMPKEFGNPFVTDKKGYTTIVAPVGKGTIFGPADRLITLRDVIMADGTSNSVMLVACDAKQAVPWTKPRDLPFDPKKPARGLGAYDGKFVLLFADCSVHTVRPTTRRNILSALITYNDGSIFADDK